MSNTVKIAPGTVYYIRKILKTQPGVLEVSIIVFFFAMIYIIQKGSILWQKIWLGK